MPTKVTFDYPIAATLATAIYYMPKNEIGRMVRQFRGSPLQAVEIQRARTIERCARSNRALRRRFLLASPGERRDSAALHVHLADTMIFHVADVEVARFVETNA